MNNRIYIFKGFGAGDYANILQRTVGLPEGSLINYLIPSAYFVNDVALKIGNAQPQTDILTLCAFYPEKDKTIDSSETCSNPSKTVRLLPVRYAKLVKVNPDPIKDTALRITACLGKYANLKEDQSFDTFTDKLAERFDYISLPLAYKCGIDGENHRFHLCAMENYDTQNDIIGNLLEEGIVSAETFRKLVRNIKEYNNNYNKSWRSKFFVFTFFEISLNEKNKNLQLPFNNIKEAYEVPLDSKLDLNIVYDNIGDNRDVPPERSEELKYHRNFFKYDAVFEAVNAPYNFKQKEEIGIEKREADTTTIRKEFRFEISDCDYLITLDVKNEQPMFDYGIMRYKPIPKMKFHFRVKKPKITVKAVIVFVIKVAIICSIVALILGDNIEWIKQNKNLYTFIVCLFYSISETIFQVRSPFVSKTLAKKFEDL
jgi:hypothetical protein